MSFLTEEERDLLRAEHRLERDRRICDRIKTVLLYDKGWSYKQIAETLLLSESTIRNHISDYQSSQKLKPKGGGSSEKLSAEQSMLLEQHLLEFTYLHVKSIVSYVELTWGVKYSVEGLTQWLNRHGFSYKKPKLVPGKADREQQLEWIEDYAKLKEELPKDETICFMDGVHPTHNVQLGYGWIKKGVEKEIPANSGRSRLNLTGAIDITSHNIVVQEDNTLNADATIRFFKKLEASQPEKRLIHLFCDNARYYRNKDVTKYLETSRIELHFLPPYSPNLNPIERLWKWMKEVVVYNTYYEEFNDFRIAIWGFFRTLSGLDPGSQLGKDFRKRIRDRFRAIGAPVTA
jgi:transposase